MRPIFESLASAAGILAVAASASAQVAPWTQLTLPANPTARERASTATDGTLLYTYGGQSGTSTSSYGNLWSFNGTTWTQVTATGASCGARCSPVMAWDTARGKLVVFSGKGAAGVWANYESTTWEWDSVNGWVPLAPATNPDARWLTGGGVYVPGVGVVFHGGSAWNSTTSAAYTSNETWAYNGTDWTLLTSTGPAIYNGALVYRSATNDLIYFGGVLGTGTGSGSDTYRYDVATNTWSQIVTATLPTSDVAGTTGPGLNAASAYYHPITHKVVIHGGQGNHGTASASKLTWEFNGVDWTNVSDAASSSIRNSSAQWVAALGKAYSSCGNSANAIKNWTLQHDVPIPPVTTYCTAGTSTNGCVPAISATGTASASSTSGFTISVANVEGQKQGLLFYGVSGQASAPWGVGGTSFLCVKSPTQRMGTQSSGGTTGACDGTIAQDWLAYVAANPSALGAPFSAGAVVNAQAWYRDPPAVKTTNLSDGLEFTLLP
jgi:hypothetical protein